MNYQEVLESLADESVKREFPEVIRKSRAEVEYDEYMQARHEKGR